MGVTTCRYALAREAVRARSDPSVKAWSGHAALLAEGRGEWEGARARLGLASVAVPHRWRTPWRTTRRETPGTPGLPWAGGYGASAGISCPFVPPDTQRCPPGSASTGRRSTDALPSNGNIYRGVVLAAKAQPRRDMPGGTWIRALRSRANTLAVWPPSRSLTNVTDRQDPEHFWQAGDVPIP
jgi:hypothetical protein